jgi:tetratricopeptide (TPR) repeat protein
LAEARAEAADVEVPPDVQPEPATAAATAAPAATQGGRPIAALQEERDFCLQSLRDLEAEHAAGDIDDTDYRALKETYTARAAAALHALDGEPAHVPEVDAEEGVDAGEEEPEVGVAPSKRSLSKRSLSKRWRRALIAFGVVAAAAIGAWVVIASSTNRLPGEEISGQALAPEVLAQSLQQAQQAAEKGDDLTAVKDYQKILDREPNQPEALTGEGWLLAQTQQPTLLKEGIGMLVGAEQAAPTYAPAHLYRGIALLSEDDYSDAIPELKWYLAHNPDPTLTPRITQALQQAEKQVASTKGKSG